MQTPIFKSFYNLVLKAQSKHLIKANLRGIHILNKIQGSIPSAQLIYNAPSKYFNASKEQYERVSNFESLTSKISSSPNLQELLNLISQNLPTMKNEQVVLSLRVLGRLQRNTPQNELDALTTDQRYIDLVEKACLAVEQFNEYEILDFLFWLRRFRLSRIKTNVTDETLTALSNKIKEFLISKSFNFRNLINLYYDLSYLNKNVDDIAKEIIEELKIDSKLITPFTIIQILQASSRKNSSIGSKIYRLNDFIINHISSLLTEFDNEQICQVFKYITMLEFDVNGPRYKIPKILYTIKSQLKESLDQYNELSILNILESYRYLPREFPTDIVDEIKEMVLLTLKHNSDNIKSFFLMEFLTHLSKLRKNHRLNEEKLRVIYDEIAKRLPNDDFLGKMKYVEQLIEIYNVSGVKDEKLLNAIYNKVSTTNNNRPYFSTKIYECLNRNGIDIKPSLSKLIEMEYYKNQSLSTKINFYSILTAVNNEMFTEKEEELKKELLDSKNELHKFVYAITNTGVYNKKTLELLEIAAKGLEPQFRQIKNVHFFKDLVLSAKSRNILNVWLEFIKKNKESFTDSEINNFYSGFFLAEQHRNEQLILFDYFTNSIPIEKVPVVRILIQMKNEPQFISDLIRNDNILNKVCNRLIRAFEAQPNNVRLPLVFSAALNFEKYGGNSNKFVSFVRKAFELSRATQTKTNQFVDSLVGLYLLDRNQLNLKEAKQLYENLKATNKEDIYSNYRLYGYLLRNMSEEELSDEKVIENVKKIIERINQTISNNNAKTTLKSLTMVLGFPVQFIRDNRDLYVKSLKACLPLGNQKLYYDIVMNLHINSSKNYPFYHPFIREIITLYTNFNKRLSLTSIVNILSKFTDLYVKNEGLYNNIVNDIKKNIDKLKLEDSINILRSFTKIGYRDSQIFEAIIEKIGLNLSSYWNHRSVLLENFFRLGYESEFIKKNLMEIPKKWKLINARSLKSYLLYCSILNLTPEQEKQLYETYIPELAKLPKTENPNRLEELLYEYVKYTYKQNPEWAEAIGHKKETQDNKRESYILTKNKNLICDYLKTMNLEFKTDEIIDGYKIDIVLPNEKILIKVLTNRDICFDKTSLKGQPILAKKIYESFTDYKTVIINSIEFYASTDHLSRVNYLTSKGIPSKNATGVYDFSKIETNIKESAENESDVGIEEGEKEFENIPIEEDANEAEIPEEQPTKENN